MKNYNIKNDGKEKSQSYSGIVQITSDDLEFDGMRNGMFCTDIDIECWGAGEELAKQELQKLFNKYKKSLILKLEEIELSINDSLKTMPTQLTQTNLKLQLELAELVQSKSLPMWESEIWLNYCQNHKEYILESKDKNSFYEGTMLVLAIDLNQNRFGAWLDLVFKINKIYEPTAYSLYLADHFKIQIAVDGLTDPILEELIKEINKL